MVRSCVVSRATVLALAAIVAACSRSGVRSPPKEPVASVPTVGHEGVAKALVAAALIKSGDKVFVSGSVRDVALLENIALEAMKVGGQPLISIWSSRLTRRSYDEVPVSYDTLAQTFPLGLVNLVDAQIAVDVGDSDNVMAGVPAARIAARSKAGVPVGQAMLRRGVRFVSLGNGMYPTAQLATRLGRPQAEVAEMFWKGVAVSPDSVRAKGTALLAGLAGGRTVTLAAANGTHITFAVTTAKGYVSDGALNPERIKQGGYAAETWLPAGELLVPVTLGTAEGTVVVDRYLYQGAIIEGLTLTFAKGKLTAMTARSAIDALRTLYDASSGGKDMFSFIDLGLNPAIQLPTDAGPVIWVRAGAVTVGMGDNTSWGGTNVSSFALAIPVSAATLSVDGRELISAGVLK